MQVKGAMALAVMALLCGSCASKSGNPASSFQAASGSASAQDDYTKPYLTEEKMTKFISSMKEEHNPFEVVFKQGGGINSLGEMQSRLEEFNAFARKYGFHDYQDYTAVWGRIVVGQTQIWGESMTEKSIKDAEKELQKPNLSPEMRQLYQDQVKSGRESLADLKKADASALNEADLALVKKYLPQIEEATKKYKQGS